MITQTDLNVKDYLKAITETYGAKFEKYRELLIEYNKKFNLTSVTEEKDILYKHFLDSVAGESLFPVGATIAEVGSGAGFPSLPLKIIRDDLQFTLFESTGKKCDFLSLVSSQLSLENVIVKNLRAEDGGRDENYREKFDVCCARAVARLNTLAEYCMPFVKVGGLFIAYKGPSEEEINEAQNAIEILGGKLEKVVSFALPEEYGQRNLIVIRKQKNTPKKYPRGQGKERSKPL